jgi:hypothetical protein
MRPWGEWSPVTCHRGRSAPLPDGPIVHLLHTHPGGTSLSMADLWIMVSRADVQSVSATTADGRIFLAQRGPRFGEMASVYPRVLAAANFDQSRRVERGMAPLLDKPAHVNLALAARGIIRYREDRFR